MEEVVLVDENDHPVGRGEKIETHLSPKLHRAFSIFVFDPSGHLLLQKRARVKYHSGGLWSNTCCSHPRPGESTDSAAHRRLKEELGFDCEITKVFDLIYYAELENNFFEYEYDHIFVGRYDGSPAPDPDEVEDWKWVDVRTLAGDLRENPHVYSYWLRASFEQLLEKLSSPVPPPGVGLVFDELPRT
jgi:isopentenyl-diphosphate delta-isomerase